MRLLCEIGGLVLAGLLILFLVIDIAIIRQERSGKNGYDRGKLGNRSISRREPDAGRCHRTICRMNRLVDR